MRQSRAVGRAVQRSDALRGSNVDKQSKKLLRCAIYTRKSTEHDLDLQFDSLDAQQEACEAYIKSQAMKAGGSFPDIMTTAPSRALRSNAPALQKLLGEVQAEKIDIIVVYEVTGSHDRSPILPVGRTIRPPCGFVRLGHPVLQHHFQHGSAHSQRAAVLRPVRARGDRGTGPRQDRGLQGKGHLGRWADPAWLCQREKELVLLPGEADTVRTIFRRYLELGSIRALAEDLDRGDFRTKRQEISNGRVRGGIRFGVGYLAQILRNRFYIGDVVYRGKVHRGEHEAIVDQAVFAAVQVKLADGAVARRLKLKASPAILMGRIYDDRGERMTPSHSIKNGARYRYYVSHALLQNADQEAGSVPRVPAPEVEQLVVNALRELASSQASDSGPAHARDRARSR